MLSDDLKNKKGQVGETKSQRGCDSILENKKGQVGETLTWIVATLIIIVVLVAFIFVANVMGKAKSIAPKKGEIQDLDFEGDWIKTKTEIAYSINDENKNKIELWIEEERISNE